MDPSFMQLLLHSSEADRNLLLLLGDNGLQNFRSDVIEPMFPEGYSETAEGRAHFGSYQWLTPQVMPLLRARFASNLISSSTPAVSLDVPPPAVPTPHPILHDFALPATASGTTNSRRIASYSRPSSDQATAPVSNVLAAARSTAHSHSLNPAATPVDNSLKQPTRQAMVKGDRKVDRSLPSSTISLTKDRLVELIQCFKAIGLWARIWVPRVGPIDVPNFTRQVEAFVASMNYSFPEDPNRVADDANSALLFRQSWRILDLVNRNGRYHVVPSNIHDSAFTWEQIKGLHPNKDRMGNPEHVPGNVLPQDRPLLLNICPRHGHMQGQLSEGLPKVNSIPRHLWPHNHTCLGWRLVLFGRFPLQDPEEDQIDAFIDTCLPTPWCPSSDEDDGDSSESPVAGPSGTIRSPSYSPPQPDRRVRPRLSDRTAGSLSATSGGPLPPSISSPVPSRPDGWDQHITPRGVVAPDTGVHPQAAYASPPSPFFPTRSVTTAAHDRLYSDFFFPRVVAPDSGIRLHEPSDASPPPFFPTNFLLSSGSPESSLPPLLPPSPPASQLTDTQSHTTPGPLAPASPRPLSPISSFFPAVSQLAGAPPLFLPSPLLSDTLAAESPHVQTIDLCSPSPPPLPASDPPEPEFPTTPALTLSALSKPMHIRTWKRLVGSTKYPEDSFPSNGFKSAAMTFQSSQQGSRVVLDILSHFASNPQEDDPQTDFPSTFDYNRHISRRAGESSDCVHGSRSFFGDRLQLWMHRSPGRGPTLDILTGTLRCLSKHSLWQFAPNGSPFMVPRLFYGISAHSSDPKMYGATVESSRTHTREAVFRAHGAIIAIYLYQCNMAPLPVSPWLVLYCILGDQVANPSCVPHDLVAKIDPKGWDLLQRILCLAPGKRRPKDVAHPTNQLLIEYLEKDPMEQLPADMTLTQQTCNDLYVLAFCVLLFGADPRSHLQLFDHPDLKAIKEGFDVTLGSGAPEGTRASFATTFHLVPGALPWQMIGHLYHRFPESIQTVLPYIQAITPPTCSDREKLLTEVVQLRVRNWLKGFGYPSEMATLGLVAEDEFERVKDDQFFRLRELLLASTGTPQIPAVDPWRIKVNVTFQPDDDGIHLAVFHTCFTSVDIIVTPMLEEMLLNDRDHHDGANASQLQSPTRSEQGVGGNVLTSDEESDNSEDELSVWSPSGSQVHADPVSMLHRSVAIYESPDEAHQEPQPQSTDVHEARDQAVTDTDQSRLDELLRQLRNASETPSDGLTVNVVSESPHFDTIGRGQVEARETYDLADRGLGFAVREECDRQSSGGYGSEQLGNDGTRAQQAIVEGTAQTMSTDCFVVLSVQIRPGITHDAPPLPCSLNGNASQQTLAMILDRVRERHPDFWAPLQTLPGDSAVASALHPFRFDDTRFGRTEHGWSGLGTLATPDVSTRLSCLSVEDTEVWRANLNLPAGVPVFMIYIVAPSPATPSASVPSQEAVARSVYSSQPPRSALPATQAPPEHPPQEGAGVSFQGTTILGLGNAGAPPTPSPQLQWLRSRFPSEFDKMQEWRSSTLYGSAYRGCRIALLLRPIYMALGWGTGGGQRFRAEVSDGVVLAASEIHLLLRISESHYESWRTLLRKVDTGLTLLRKRPHLTEEEEGLKAICEVMVRGDDLDIGSTNPDSPEAEALTINTSTLTERLKRATRR
ncbi:hypothetical protein V5O48_008994 [Marasmius crinis-equi]|uniref:Uncharacterized protein n=1 Tax=Marasmius crinis-equi TaxID=585013 RepID=A0ABR3FCH8_9AGAR